RRGSRLRYSRAMSEGTRSLELRERVARAVGPYLDEAEGAGLVVDVIHGDDRGIFGFGRLDRDDPTAAGEATLFEIGSILCLPPRTWDGSAPSRVAQVQARGPGTRRLQGHRESRRPH